MLSINIAFKNADVEVSTHIDRGLRDASEYHASWSIQAEKLLLVAKKI